MALVPQVERHWVVAVRADRIHHRPKILETAWSRPEDQKHRRPPWIQSAGASRLRKAARPRSTIDPPLPPAVTSVSQTDRSARAPDVEGATYSAHFPPARLRRRCGVLCRDAATPDRVHGRWAPRERTNSPPSRLRLAASVRKYDRFVESVQRCGLAHLHRRSGQVFHCLHPRRPSANTVSRSCASGAANPPHPRQSTSPDPPTRSSAIVDRSSIPSGLVTRFTSP